MWGGIVTENEREEGKEGRGIYFWMERWDIKNYSGSPPSPSPISWPYINFEVLFPSLVLNDSGPVSRWVHSQGDTLRGLPWGQIPGIILELILNFLFNVTLWLESELSVGKRGILWLQQKSWESPGKGVESRQEVYVCREETCMGTGSGSYGLWSWPCLHLLWWLQTSLTLLWCHLSNEGLEQMSAKLA